MATIPRYPISDVFPELQTALREGTTAVLTSPPGSGKTTILPLLLLEEPWVGTGKILILQPRRIAARSVCERMAEILGEKAGQTVGFRVRMESAVGPTTRIEVMTEGVLTRRLQNDPELTGVSLVVFDEFHERSIHSDLALVLARDVQASLRPDLRILIMSATLNQSLLERTLGGAPVISGGVRLFPVEVQVHEPANLRLPELATQAIRRAAATSTGDILAFLPGVGEIRRTAEMLVRDVTDRMLVVELYGDLPYTEQRKAILPDPGGRRKVVLATPIAETSITIEGVSTVVDSGFEKVSRYNPGRGGNELVLQRISRESAEQRAGRAGRLGPGRCIRLYQGELLPSREAEILRTDLMPLALEVAAWGTKDYLTLPWVDAPPKALMEQAAENLIRLHLLNPDRSITERGRRALALPIHPRLANMILAAEMHGGLEAACDLAALLEERDFAPKAGCGVESRLEHVERLRKGGRPSRDIERGPVERVVMSANRIYQALRRNSAKSGESYPSRDAGFLLSYAYPERIAQRRSASLSDPRYLLASGIGVRLPAGDPLLRENYLVVADMLLRGAEAEIRLAAGIQEEAVREIFQGDFVRERRVNWSESDEAVIAEEFLRLGALVLERRPIPDIPEHEKTGMLLEGIRKKGARALTFADDTRALLARLRVYSEAFPERDLPPVSDEALLESLEEWLAPYLSGMSRLKHLEKLSISDALLSRYSWDARKKMDEAVPHSITLPGGRSRRIEYEGEQAPILAATIQELFGWSETPKLGDGRIELTLHILSPARRPIQVTKDLRSFWMNTYAEVRKELRGRYPKHKWPERPEVV